MTVLRLKRFGGIKPNLMINIKPKQLFASISIYTFLIFAKSWERRNVLIGDDLRYLIPPSLKWDIRWVIEPAKNGYLNVLQKLVGLISSFFPLENLAILMFFMTGVIWIATSVSIQLAVHAYTQKFYAGLISGLVLVMTPSNTLYVIGITATAHFPALFGILVITSFATYPSSKKIFFFMIVLMSLVFLSTPLGFLVLLPILLNSWQKRSFPSRHEKIIGVLAITCSLIQYLNYRQQDARLIDPPTLRAHFYNLRWAMYSLFPAPFRNRSLSASSIIQDAPMVIIFIFVLTTFVFFCATNRESQSMKTAVKMMGIAFFSLNIELILSGQNYLHYLLIPGGLYLVALVIIFTSTESKFVMWTKITGIIFALVTSINVATSFWSPDYDELFTDARWSGLYEKNSWSNKIEIGRAKCLNSDTKIQLGDKDNPEFSFNVSCELLEK